MSSKSFVLTIPDGFMGTCSWCMKADATTKVWRSFPTSLTTLDGRPLEGAWVYMCDACTTETRGSES